MLLRISLIIALLAGLGGLYVGHVKISEKITTLTSDLETARNNETTARQAETKAKGEAKKAKEDLAQATQELAEKTQALESITGRLAEQEKRANKLFEDWTNVSGQLTEAQRELTAFRGAGFTVEQLRTVRETLTKLTQERDVFVDENKVLNREVNRLKAELARYTGEGSTEVPLPPGLKGKVVAVDPKYNFVVLDIGANQGVLERGKMLVSRDGKLVAKVQITRVEPNRSIANIIPEWKQDDVMEGDQVLY